jgi:hypothetical protein
MIGTAEEIYGLLQTVCTPYIMLYNFCIKKNQQSKHTPIFHYSDFCWSLFKMEHAVLGTLTVQKLQFLT